MNILLVPEPFQFNPLKHHMMYIREFISAWLPVESSPDRKDLIRELRRIGSSVMDVYTGNLPVEKIFQEILDYLKENRLAGRKEYSDWTGTGYNNYRPVTLSDLSVWMMKYHADEKRYVHIFPARQSPDTFRVKANTLKSAILYYIIIGKDFISGKDLNFARSLLGLSPVKDPAEAEAITEMIEVLRNG